MIRRLTLTLTLLCTPVAAHDFWIDKTQVNPRPMAAYGHAVGAARRNAYSRQYRGD